MSEKVLGFRIEVKGTDQQTQQLSKLGGEMTQLRSRIKLLNDIQRKGTPLTARQTKEFELLTTQLKAHTIQRNALNKQILVNNGVMKQSQGLFSGFKSAILSSGAAILGWTALIGGAIAVVKNMVGIFMDFDKASSGLQAVLDATGNEMDSLKTQAKNLGSVTAFTASQVLDLQTEFAKLGFPTADILNMTSSTLDAAAALGSELGEQAALSGAVLKQYSLDSSEAARVNDVLAKSASSSALDFTKLSTALPIVGATAATAGVSLERTTALLGTLADRGIDASTAATSLRNIFLTLSAKGLTWEQAMQKINTATDKNAVAFDLFGKRGATAAVILAGTGESAAVLEQKLLGAEGAAKKMADTMLNNLSGDVTKAKSAWEGFILSLEDGEGVFSRGLRSVTQYSTGILGLITNINNGKGVMNSLKQFGLDTGLALGVLDEEFKNVGQAMINNEPVTRELIKRLKEKKITADEFRKATDMLASSVKILTAEERESAKVFAKLDSLKKKVAAEENAALERENKIFEEAEKRRKEQQAKNKQFAEEEKKRVEKEAADLEIARAKGEADGQAFLDKQRAEFGKTDRELKKMKLEQEFQDRIDAITGQSEKEIEILLGLEEQKKLALKEQQEIFKIEDEEKRIKEREEFQKAEDEWDKKQLEKKRAVEQAKVDIVRDSLQLLSQINNLAAQQQLQNFDKDAKKKLDSFKGTEQEKENFKQDLDKKRQKIEKDIFERQKKINTLMAKIETAMSVVKALGSAPPPYSFVLAALAGAAGAVQIATIQGQQFEDGGLVEGASHRQGGIQMYHKSGQHLGEMEGNEYIVSAKRVKEIGRENLDAINFGGVTPTVSGYFANGGQVPNVSGIGSTNIQQQQMFSMAELGDLISRKMEETVLRTKVINNAVDTFGVAQNVKNTENSLKFG